MCITRWTINRNRLMFWMTIGVRYVHLGAICPIAVGKKSFLEFMANCEHFIPGIQLTQSVPTRLIPSCHTHEQIYS